MPLYGNIVVIRRSGKDGIRFPLTTSLCLFGRRTECDIRIQLPQVSKEHCKIEVNENKQAILTNLSEVNPTQLNRSCFQQPVLLKHGDVLTIIDRSFRFEYPQTTPEKRRSRTLKDKTSQVLHVQQVTGVEIQHQQTSDAKSLLSSDHAECEGKTADEHEQSTEENDSKALPFKPQTPKSSQRIHRPRKTQMSPFSKLYEKMKHEIQVTKLLPKGDVSGPAVEEDGKSVLPEPSSQNSSSICDLGSLTEEEEKRESKKIEECQIIKLEGTPSEFNHISAAGSATKKSTKKRSTKSPRRSVSESVLGEPTMLGQANVERRPFPSNACSIVCLGYAEKPKTDSSATAVEKPAQSEEDRDNWSTPPSTSRSRSCLVSPINETGGVNPVHTATPSRQSLSMKCKSLSEALAETQRDGSASKLASRAGQKSGTGKMRVSTSDLLVEINDIPEHRARSPQGNKIKKELATKREDLREAILGRYHRLSEEGSELPSLQEDNKATSERTTPGSFAEEKSDKSPELNQKRRSGGVSLLRTLAKKKRVSFGGQLSPELFDRTLPPNSPLKRGATPARRSLPSGKSPRAVLKKTLGPKCFQVQDGEMTPKRLAQKSPEATSPAPGRATPQVASASPSPYRIGRFSVSQAMAPLPIAEEEHEAAEDTSAKETSDTPVKTPRCKKTPVRATPDRSARSGGPARKATPMKRRGEAVEAISAKRRSGASSANLLVAKSWAEVVRLGVARPQAKTAKKSVREGRSRKKRTQSSKTPEQKIKDHVSTGHAESPATIVVGRAYSTKVMAAGQVPKVVTNPTTKLNMDMDESFTGMTEMFQTPKHANGSVEECDHTPMPTGGSEETFELYTPEETGEMLVSPLNSSDVSQQNHSPDTCDFLRDDESLKSSLPEAVHPENPEAMDEEQLLKTVMQKSEHVEDSSGMKKLKTPREKKKDRETLSGVKQLFRTPKQTLEPEEDLSGLEELFKTPQEKLEDAEPLSGIKELLRTPLQKLDPAEVLSAIKELLATPQQKLDPAKVLSEIRQLLGTSQPGESADAVAFGRLSKTPVEDQEAEKEVVAVDLIKKSPKHKYQPVEDMIGVIRIFKTPKQKAQLLEDMFHIDRLVKTPKEKHQPVDDFVGLQRLMAEPRANHPDAEDDYTGLKEMFAEPEEVKVTSVEVKDCQQKDDPSTKSKHRCENKGNAPQCEDSQHQESTGKVKLNQRITRSRLRQTVHPCSTRGLNLNELQSLGERSSQELVLPTKSPTEVKGIDSTEAPVPATRVRRVDHQVEQTASEKTYRTRRLRKNSPANVVTRDEQAPDTRAEAATAEESEKGAKCEVKATQKGVKSLRMAAKPSARAKADVKDAHKVVKDESSPGATQIPAENDDSPAVVRPKQKTNVQGALKAAQTEILAEDPAQKSGTTSRRGRSRKVYFELEEATQQGAEGIRSLPGGDTEITSNDGQDQTLENPPSQLRRSSRRKKVDSSPQIAASASVEKPTLIADHKKSEAFVKEQDSALGATLLTRRELLEGEDEKMPEKEDQNPALGNQRLPVKEKALARDRRQKIDLVAEAKSSSLLQRRPGLSEITDQEKDTNEEQNMPWGPVPCAKERLRGRCRGREAAVASQTANDPSRRGEGDLSADNSRDTPKGQTSPSGTCVTFGKEYRLRRGRRQETTLGATHATQTKPALPQESGRKNDVDEKKLTPDNSASQGKVTLSQGNSKQIIASPAGDSSSLECLRENGPVSKASSSRVRRRKTVKSGNSGTVHTEEPTSPKGRGRKRLWKADDDLSLRYNIPAEGSSMQLRNKRRRMVEFSSDTATSTSRDGTLSTHWSSRQAP